MTALTMSARPGTDTDLRPVPWRRMAWVTWRQHRFALAGVAGLLGALLVLPQGIAFATLAGLPPQYGLYAAVIPCVVAALFGSSWHVMSGPTNANSLALFAMLAPLAVPGSDRYIDLALMVTILVGILQFSVGALRLGSLANFISPAALLGFTGGAAALMAHDAEIMKRAGMIAVNPQWTWHRFSSVDGVTLMTLTPLPSEVIEADVDDPRQVERTPA